MASRDRKEYQREYREKNKDNLNQRRRALEKEKKLQSLKNELEKVDSSFDISLNPYYVTPFKDGFTQSYFEKLRKHFELTFDIENLSSRKTDSKSYLKRREKFVQENRKEWDLKHRIVKWRLFRKAVLTRMNQEPRWEHQLFNNVYEPDEIQKDHENYRQDLMYLTQIQADDPLITVSLEEDWAREDQEEYERELMESGQYDVAYY